MFYWCGRKDMDNSSIESANLNSSRRNFLLTASVAAAAGLTLADARLFAAPVEGQNAAAASPAGVQLFSAVTLEGDINALRAAPANNTIVDNKNFAVILTVETAKSAKEFEYHEGRDHVFYILDGTTVYEVGGTPKGAHGAKPGEWNAPESEGAVKYTLKKGDMLVVPRNTPHKRTTEGSVTLILVSPMGSVKA
jgi:mannose-6-phosphate isomerase-like protein (cupin superfamily)